MKIILFDDSIKKFILSLEKSSVAKVFRTIDLLEEFNYQLGLPHSKKIDKNLFELRIYGSQKIRVFYTFYKNNIFILHIFVKKTTKIPTRELKVAILKQQQLN